MTSVTGLETGKIKKKRKKVIGKLDIEKVVGKGEGTEQEKFIT